MSRSVSWLDSALRASSLDSTARILAVASARGGFGRPPPLGVHSKRSGNGDSGHKDKRGRPSHDPRTVTTFRTSRFDFPELA